MWKRFRSRVYLINDSLFILCTSWQFIHSLLKLWKWCHSIHQLFWQERRGKSRSAYKPVYGNTLDTTATTTTTTVVPRKTAMTSFETQWKTKYFALAAWVQLLCPLPSRGSQKQREVHGRIPVEVDGKSSSLFGLLFSLSRTSQSINDGLLFLIFIAVKSSFVIGLKEEDLFGRCTRFEKSRES